MLNTPTHLHTHTQAASLSLYPSAHGDGSQVLSGGEGAATSSIFAGLGIAGQSDGGGWETIGGPAGQSIYYEAQAVADQGGGGEVDAIDALPLAVALPADDGAADSGAGEGSAFSFIVAAPSQPAMLRAAAPPPPPHTGCMPPPPSFGAANGAIEESAFGFLAGDSGAPQREAMSAFSFLGDMDSGGGAGMALDAGAPSAPALGGLEDVGGGCSQQA